MSEVEPTIPIAYSGDKREPEAAADSPPVFEISRKRILAIEDIANNPEISARIDRSRAIGAACYAFELVDPGLTAADNTVDLIRLRYQVRDFAVDFADYGFDLLTKKINELREASGSSEPLEIAALRAIYDHAAFQSGVNLGDSRRIAEATVWTVWQKWNTNPRSRGH